MKSAALGYGAVIHEGLAEWYRGSTLGLSHAARLEAAISKLREKFPADHPVDDHRNLNKAEELMKAYVKQYPGENFKVLQVEVPFTLGLGLHLLQCEHCGYNNDDGISHDQIKCGRCESDLEPIEYGGIIDAIVSFGSVLYALEHKTTSELGSLFFRQFETSNQVTGYCWALKQLSSHRVAGAIINALCTTKGGNIKFDRATTNRSDDDFVTWRRSIQVELGQMSQHIRLGVFPHRTEHCLTKYGLCSYHGVCTLATAAEQDRALETYYEYRPWDHELRDVTIPQNATT